VLLGSSLDAAKAFTALSLVNIMRFPLVQLPQLLTLSTQYRVSAGRLQARRPWTVGSTRKRRGGGAGGKPFWAR
jgi:hypothetical protein